MHYEMLNEFKNNFSVTLSKSINDFKKYFPDACFDEYTFYILAGNQSFNARADMVEGKVVFEISAEMFENIRGLQITLMHELFHLYHMKCFENAGNKIEDRLYFPLIFEGCAVYFSNLSTGFEIEDCMQMGLPGYLNLFDRVNFKNKCEKSFIKSSKLLYENIDRSVPVELYKKLFGAKIDNNDEPCRLGYYIGFMMIKSVADEIPLEKIISMNKKELIVLCQSQLKKIIRK